MSINSILLILALAVATPLANVGCANRPPSARVVEVQTLKSIGQAAEEAIVLSARLYQAGRITAAQSREALDFYDRKFQPAFRVAVAAVQANLNSVAGPELVALAGQLSALVISFQK